MEASHTPYQAQLMQEHRERRARLAAKAKPDRPVQCLSASERTAAFERPVLKLLPQVATAETPQDWAERQVKRYEPWFLIEGEIDPPAVVRPSIHLIQRITAKHFEVAVSDLVSENRQAPIVRARQVAAYLSKMMTLRSLPEIGRRFGGRDHSTILFSVRKIAGLIESDVELARKVEAIKLEVGEEA